MGSSSSIPAEIDERKRAIIPKLRLLKKEVVPWNWFATVSTLMVIYT